MIRTRGILNDGDTLSYAFGLTHGVRRGLPTLGHGGSFVGYRAAVLTYPDQAVGVVTLCNRSDVNPSGLSNQVGELLLGDLMEPPAPSANTAPRATSSSPAEERLSDEALRALVGSYYSPELDVTWSIEVAGGTLRLSVGNSLDGEFVAVRGDDGVLRLTRAGVSLRLIREGDGVTGLRADAGRVQNLWFVKR